MTLDNAQNIYHPIDGLIDIDTSVLVISSFASQYRALPWRHHSTRGLNGDTWSGHVTRATDGP